MLSLAKKQQQQKQQQEEQRRRRPGADASQTLPSTSPSAAAPSGGGSVSLRDRLLVREVQELGAQLPSTCRVTFPDVDQLHWLVLTVRPDEGAWAGGVFVFDVRVGADYNLAPPTVRCRTRLWHPNIGEDGAVCLSLLRDRSIDGFGWSPSRQLKDVVWGINSLFTDLLNFDDPLNTDAAEQFAASPRQFRRKVAEYLRLYANEPGAGGS